jgi:AraC family transcriptional regulator of adaptative response/methylated-DNA-[protein]-cysteine methyltransferase
MDPVRSVSFAIVPTALGPLLVAASERGVCRVAFGDDERELAALLARELPYARLARGGSEVEAWAAALARAVDGDTARLEVPLDVAGSRFQRRVWDALRAIPRGEVRSYGNVARALGAPRAYRAVAQACGANPVPIAIPCHRVVASDGLGGYRFGVARKRALLAREGAPNEKGPAEAGPFRASRAAAL